MILARIKTFFIDLPFEISRYPPLKNLAVHYEWNPDTKTTRWEFYVVNMPEVIAVLGVPIQFDMKEGSVAMVLSHCPNLVEEIKMGRYKGTGYIHIKRDPDEPNVFLVEFPMRKHPTTTKVPIEAIERLWNTIVKFPKGEKVRSKLSWELWCKEIGVIRYNRTTSGSFDQQKFFGDRTTYARWYGAVKVLQHYRLVEHDRSGKIIRLADELNFMARFDQKTGKENYSIYEFDEGGDYDEPGTDLQQPPNGDDNANKGEGNDTDMDIQKNTEQPPKDSAP